MGDGTAEVVSNQPADATVAAAADLARRLGGLDGALAIVADQPAQIRAALVRDAAAGFQVSEHAVAFCLADQPAGRQAALAVHRPARLRAEYLAAGTQADQPAGIPRAAGLHLAAGATIGDVAEHVVADQAADVQAGPVGLDLPWLPDALIMPFAFSPTRPPTPPRLLRSVDCAATWTLLWAFSMTASGPQAVVKFSPPDRRPPCSPHNR